MVRMVQNKKGVNMQLFPYKSAAPSGYVRIS